MKYILTEEQNTRIVFARRNSRDYLENYIKRALQDSPTANCLDGANYYVEDVINYTVDLILNDINPDLALEENYEQLFDLFTDRCMELFEEELTTFYHMSCD